MSDFLKQMADSSAARAAALPEAWRDDALDKPSFPLSLDRFNLIAEIKHRSPAEGELAGETIDCAGRAQMYADGGAAAISVLTEPDRFDGDLSHLEEVVDVMTPRQLPVMRKDFLVSPLQVLEAKAAGASGVLLIAGMLDVRQLDAMLDCAFEHDLFVLLESFTEQDLEYSAHLLERPNYREKAAQQKLLVGINTRDLRTLHVDPQRLEKYAPFLPSSAVCVAESGLHTPEDAGRVAAWGYAAGLVGTALMRADEPGRLVADMIAAGRNA